MDSREHGLTHRARLLVAFAPRTYLKWLESSASRYLDLLPRSRAMKSGAAVFLTQTPGKLTMVETLFRRENIERPIA